MSKFCPKCTFVLNLQKNIERKEITNLEELILILLENKDNIKTSIKFSSITDSKTFKELNEQEKNIVKTNYNFFTSLNKVGFYKCNNCGYFENIKNGTVLIDNESNYEHKPSSDLFLKLQKNNPILPRTKDYICLNKECETNTKNSKDREAVFYRIGNSYQIKYLCCICNNEWIVK